MKVCWFVSLQNKYLAHTAAVLEQVSEDLFGCNAVPTLTPSLSPLTAGACQTGLSKTRGEWERALLLRPGGLLLVASERCVCLN